MSSYAANAGDILVIITVLQFPPNESFKSLVSLESLYGICVFLLAAAPFEPFVYSHKAFMQLPKANKLLLILAPSTSLIPLLLVFEARSDPAKSIKDNLAMLISAFIP